MAPRGWRVVGYTPGLLQCYPNLVSKKTTFVVLNSLLCKFETSQQHRCYARGLRRTPINVIMPEGEQSDRHVVDEKRQILKPKNQKHIFYKEPYEQNQEFEREKVDVRKESMIIPNYEKLGDDSRILTNVVTLAKSRNQREKKGKILLEGKRLIKDALGAGIQLDSMFFSHKENLAGIPLENVPNLKLYKVTYNNLSIWSDLTTSPGVLAIFQRPNYDTLQLKTKTSLPLTVICDNIREPGNLGAILRCAAAVGCKQILLTKGCVDLWEPKVLRSAAGAHFHVKLINNVGWELICNYVSDEVSVFLATNKNDELEGYVHHCEDDTENVDPSLFEKRKYYELNTDKVIDPTYLNKQKLQHFKSLPLKTVAYFDANFGNFQKEIVLVVGGETHGLSPTAYKFAHDKGGHLVYIPLKNNIESLNAGIALGIIAFEIQKQYTIVNRTAKRYSVC